MKRLASVFFAAVVMLLGLKLPAHALSPQEAFDAVNRSPFHGASFRGSYPGGNIMASFWVWQDGEIVLYDYHRRYGFDRRQQTWSGTKPFVSALTGIAIQLSYIESVHQYVIDFFPDAVIPPGQESKYDMTVLHLLNMTSGLPVAGNSGFFRPLFVRHDAGLASFMLPQRYAPGERFRYCFVGASSQALVGVVERATGQNLYDFGRQHLFDPLGMDSIRWTRTQSGSPVGGTGLYISPRDFFTFGQLHLQDGVWEGRRILPVGWVNALMPGVEVDRDFNDRHRMYHVSDTDAGWRIRASGMGGIDLSILVEHNTMVMRLGRNMGYISIAQWLASERAVMRRRCWLYLI